ncbi:hypothetical protein HNY73_004573 [Argiope bruennichi]|uniref:Uncharacterized protein n=1 Tax=Argiope bruennichi TaxID=94029 RepID=A0A8T0FPD9_ARGBR|nr:hypothetical protein HNY73_004573 [Argiope bruennichi]
MLQEFRFITYHQKILLSWLHTCSDLTSTKLDAMKYSLLMTRQISSKLQGDKPQSSVNIQQNRSSISSYFSIWESSNLKRLPFRDQLLQL